MSWKIYNTVAAAQKDRFAQAHATQICLRGSDVSDETLADCLRLFPKLQSLDIADTSLTEAGLSTLRDFPNLFTVIWFGTRSSTEYREQLSEELGLEVIDENGESNLQLTGMLIW